MENNIMELVTRKVRYGEECQKNWKTKHPVLFAFTAYDFQSHVENGDFVKIKRRNELAKEANALMTETVHGTFMVEEEKEADILVKKYGWKKVDVITCLITNPGTGFTSNRTFTVVEN